MEPQPPIRYRRSRFSTRLPVDRRYTASHCWLLEECVGSWRVGFTRFATRMLGDFVEFGFDVAAGDTVGLGQVIGSVEGFKAISQLFCVVDGRFMGGNPALEKDITLADTDPYGEGWLYRVRGTPDPACVDVHGYVDLLDGTIDRLLKGSAGG